MTAISPTVRTAGLPSQFRSVARSAALHLVQLTLAVVFVVAGTTTLLGGVPEIVAPFHLIENITGVGAWLRQATGLVEVLGGTLLCARASAGVGAVLLGVVMVGAIVTHVFVLHTTPTSPAGLVAALAAVAYAHRAALVVVASFLERNL